jgi:signal peptidase I
MMAGYYDVGDVVRVNVNFKGDTGPDVDPSVVTLSIWHPDGSITDHVYGTDPGVIKDNVGDYHYDILIVAEGLHQYRWVGSGAVAPGAGESSFIARRTVFA